MSGSLIHGQQFEKVEYIGNDGLPHYEIKIINGDLDCVSLSNWTAIVNFCEEKGIPHSDWPVYESDIDVPLDEIRQKNVQLRDVIISLGEEAEEVVAQHRWLAKLVGYLKQGEIFFFSMM